METEFKVGECVQMIHGYTPNMTIAEIYEQQKEARCSWYDSKTGSVKFQDLPLSVLKHCPQQATASESLKAMQEIIPPRR